MPDEDDLDEMRARVYGELATTAWNKAVQSTPSDNAPLSVPGVDQNAKHAALPPAVVDVLPTVRKLRYDYMHEKCGQVTRMPPDCARTYSVKPDAYNATYCATCRGYFPVGADGEFVWRDDGTKVGT